MYLSIYYYIYLSSVEPPMMELHEELRVIQVIKAAQDLKCEHYKDRVSIYKRYFIIEKQIVRHFRQYSEGLLNPPSLLCNLKNLPFS